MATSMYSLRQAICSVGVTLVSAPTQNVRIDVSTLHALVQQGFQLCSLAAPATPTAPAKFTQVLWPDIIACWAILEAIADTTPSLALFVHYHWPMRFLCAGSRLEATATPAWVLAADGRIARWTLQLVFAHTSEDYPAAVIVAGSYISQVP